MHIQKVRLINWTGIHDGTGLNDIEINFPDPATLPSRIILFMGENGSGKSTMLSSLHPFASAFDGRDESLIREGMEGTKEIEFVRGNDVYRAVHYIDRRKTPVKTRSFLERNGNVLNENGLVGSFHDALKAEIGLEESFFKVGRIVNTGSTNFVDLSAGQRKDFTMLQLPDLEPWMAAFRESGKKCLSSEKTLKYLGDEIGRLPERDKLEADKAQAARMLKDATAVFSRATRARGIKETEMNRLKESDEVVSATELLETFNTTRINFSKASRRLTTFSAEWSEMAKLNISATRKKIEAGVRKSEEVRLNLANATEKVESTTLATLKIKRTLTSKKSELARYSDIDGTDKNEIVSIISGRKKKISELKKELNALKKHLGVAAGNVDTIPLKKNGLLESKHRQVADKITSFFGILGVSPDGTLDLAIKYAKKDMSPDVLLNKAKTIESEIKEKTTLINSLKAQAAAAKLLESRPKTCRIDTCPFVLEGKAGAEAGRYAEREEADLLFMNQNVNMYKNASEVMREMKAISKLLLDDELGQVLVEVAGWDIVDINDNFKSIAYIDDIIETGGLASISAFNPQRLMNAIEVASDISALEDINRTDTARLEILETSGDILESLKSNITTLEEELEETSNTLSEAVEVRDNATADQRRIEKALTAIRDYLTILEEVESTKNARDEAELAFTGSEEALELLNTATTEFDECVEAEKDAIEALDVARTVSEEVAGRLSKLNDFESRQAEFQANYIKQNEVRLTCDPKRGLPLAFMRDFLESTKTMANNLFDMAFRGKFHVDFIVTDKEFRIQIEKDDGSILSDVKLASDGQRAFIKTIISVSLLSCYAKVFPILALDEVDAVLDVKHRTSFLDIIEGQIRQLKLGQVFVISHNEEFRNDNIPVVLFPGHTLGSGDKNRVIADFSRRS